MHGKMMLAALLLTACAKGREVKTIQRPESVQVTQLGCPEGTIEMGARPPEGSDLWCAIAAPGVTPVRHGPARTWWADGRQQTVGVYEHDVKSGHWTFWSADGHLEQEGDFEAGRKSGYWILYDADGEVAEEGPMRDGGRHGIWVNHQGKVPVEGTWVDGEKDGVWIEYDAEGKPVRERIYRRGRQISQRER